MYIYCSIIQYIVRQVVIVVDIGPCVLYYSLSLSLSHSIVILGMVLQLFQQFTGMNVIMLVNRCMDQ